MDTVVVVVDGKKLLMTELAKEEVETATGEFSRMLMTIAEQLRKRDKLNAIEYRHIEEAWSILTNGHN